MKPLNYRQVHLDFHTSEHIKVGDKFDPEQFKKALKLAHINSITLFSKCHHGWSYHPTKANEIHPQLDFDLLGAQLKACKEIGVNAPVYLSAGYDEKYARRNPHHIVKSTPDASVDFLNRAHYKPLCFNTPYLDTLVAQIEEVMEKYNPTGIFLDITSQRICYCQHCIESMRAQGLDPKNEADVRLHAERVYVNYCERTREAVRKHNPETTIFQNGSHIIRGRRDLAHFNTHLELESLPTGGWGYDHFPMSASYARVLGMDFLGMTGKFHLSWGEFGGYKHPNALRYEAALSNALGAKCSIGDQLHPSGEMNLSTYELIGKAYKEVEAKEPFLKNAHLITDIGVLSTQAFTDNTDTNCINDVGASRILLEGKYLFDLIDDEADFSSYKLLLLPDLIKIDDSLKMRLEKFVSAGGRLLLSGKSGLSVDEKDFALDFGTKYLGENGFCPSYMIPEYEAVNGKTAYVMYSRAQDIETCAPVKAYLEEPYFNRTPEHFFSHQHTPNNSDTKKPAVVLTECIGYIGWNVFEEYALKGSYHLKEMVLNMLSALLPEPSLKITAPDRAVASLAKQGNRHIAHILFAHTTLRGKGTEIIEDIVPLYNVKLSVKLPEKPRRVCKAECIDGEITETPLNFSWDGTRAQLLVDKVELHAMVIFE